MMIKYSFAGCVPCDRIVVCSRWPSPLCKATNMRVLLATLVILLLCGCRSYEPVERLGGVRSITPAGAGIIIRPDEALQVGVPQGQAISLSDGEQVSFGDGYHVTIRLTYYGSAAGRYRFRHETLHIPPGGKIKKDIAYISVPAYEAQTPRQEPQSADDAGEGAWYCRWKVLFSGWWPIRPSATWESS